MAVAALAVSVLLAGCASARLDRSLDLVGDPTGSQTFDAARREPLNARARASADIFRAVFSTIFSKSSPLRLAAKSEKYQRMNTKQMISSSACTSGSRLIPSLRSSLTA